MEILNELIAALGPDRVVHGDRVAEHTNGFLDPTPASAIAIVFPSCTQAVSDVLRICNAHKQPVVVQGGKTGAVKGHVSQADEIAINLEKMAAIEAIDDVSCTATVQAGCVLQTLQEAAQEHGLQFALDFGGRGSCTIGGNISTNAGGERVVRFGMMREQVLGLEVVLADGTIVSSMSNVIKNNTGYDLKQFFIGAEGTLGVVTRAVLRLRPAIQANNVALLSMARFDQVLSTLRRVDAAAAGQVSAYELMSKSFYAANSRILGYAPFDEPGDFLVVIEVLGDSSDHDRSKFETLLGRLFEEELIEDAVIAKSLGETEQIWALRECTESFSHSGVPFFLYDVSVAMSHMEDYARSVEDLMQQAFEDVELFTVGHVGDGNLHFVVLPHCDDDIAVMRKRSDEAVYEPLARYSGSVSAEHGIGLEKKRYLPIARNAEEVALMRTIKQALDPKSILGRGRIFDQL